jgi:hypothetical protein
MHPSTLISIGNLAQVLKKQSKLEEAQPVLRQSWLGQRHVLGPTHPHTIIASYNLVNLLGTLGRVDEARELCESELAVCRDALGNSHEDTQYFEVQLAGLARQEQHHAICESRGRAVFGHANPRGLRDHEMTKGNRPGSVRYQEKPAACCVVS